MSSLLKDAVIVIVKGSNMRGPLGVIYKLREIERGKNNKENI